MAENPVTVPPEHWVGVFGADPLPGVASTPGGVWIAQLGLGSDALAAELETIVKAVDALLAGPRPHVILPHVTGDLASLFAPANPEVIQVGGLLVWVIDPAALAGAPSAPSLVQRLLRHLHRYARWIAQIVLVHELTDRRARSIAGLIQGFNIGVRTLDPTEPVVLLEVHRPEEVVLSAIAGTPCDASLVTEAARKIIEEIDRVEGDAKRVADLERAQLTELAELLAPRDGEPRVASVARAAHLRGLLLAADGDAAGRLALYRELLVREIPLLVIADLEGGVKLRRWPTGVALAAYPDRVSLHAAARELGLAAGTFGVAELAPRKLFEWASGQGWAVAINAYRDDGGASYIGIVADEVRALARGELPAADL